MKIFNLFFPYENHLNCLVTIMTSASDSLVICSDSWKMLKEICVLSKQSCEVWGYCWTMFYVIPWHHHCMCVLMSFSKILILVWIIFKTVDFKTNFVHNKTLTNHVSCWYDLGPWKSSESHNQWVNLVGRNAWNVVWRCCGQWHI